MLLIKKISKILLLSLLVLTSCATIVNGTHQTIGISSYPSEADVIVDRFFVGRTPLCVAMERKDNHIVRIELPGYLPYEVILQKKFSGWVIGNIIFGGIIGIAIDAITGGIYRLTPEQIEAEMISNGFDDYQAQPDYSYISVVMKPDPKWEKIGSLSQMEK